jgi:hypothetical protein
VNSIRKFNDWFAVKLTSGVGTMWCAYLFTLIALKGLPGAIEQSASTHGESLVQWFAQTFVQLVLLSVIIVGQNLQSAASEKRATAQNEVLTLQMERQERHLKNLILALGQKIDDDD